MEIVQLLALGFALLIFLSVFRRRTGRACIAPSVPTFEVSDPAVARLMLVGHADQFSNRPIAPFPVQYFTGPCLHLGHNISTAPHGPLWRALRCNLTAGILHPSRLGRFAPLQREAVEGLIAGICTGGTGELVVRDSLYDSVFALLVRLCFGDGIDASHVRAIQHVLQDFSLSLVDAAKLAGSRLARLVHWQRWRRLISVHDRLKELVLPLITARLKRLSRCCNDGVASYVDSFRSLHVPNYNDASINRTLTDDEKVTLVWEFLGAGTETVVACVEWTLALLITQPKVQMKLYHEVAGDESGVVASSERLRNLPYLRAVMLESLRLHPPMPFSTRDVGAEGAAVGGATVPADTMLVRFLINLRHIGRDIKAWTDPDEFQPERFLPGGEGESVSPMPGSKEIMMMPFGAGRRHCPGAGLGLMHVRCFLAALVREFEWAPPEAGGSIDLTEQDGFVRHMKTPLKAHLTRRMYS